MKGSKPIRLSPYRVPHMYRGWMREELDRMSEDGIIEESVSQSVGSTSYVSEEKRWVPQILQ